MKRSRYFIAAIICFALVMFCVTPILADDGVFKSLKVVNWVLTGGDIATTRIGISNPKIYEKGYYLSIPIKLCQVYLTNKSIDWIYSKNKTIANVTLGIINALTAWVVYKNIRTIYQNE